MARRSSDLHVLCTVNCELESIEPALLRPGRLRHHRRVGLLDAVSAAELARLRGLPWQSAAGKTHYSLAEVLNPNPPMAVPRTKPAIGFAH